MPELRRYPPRVSGYVAAAGRPYLLDRGCPDAVLRGLLRRTDVHSAMSVPFRCGPRMTGVVNVSLASNEDHVFRPDDMAGLIRRLSSRQDRRFGAATNRSNRRGADLTEFTGP